MNKLYINDIKEILISIRNIMIENRENLINADSVMGDGDLGITMSEGFTKICEHFNEFESEKTIGRFLMKVGFDMANTVPSTMGTLVGTMIMKSGADLKHKEFIEVSDIESMFKNAIQGLEKRGKAKRGDKTLLDALYPAMEQAQIAIDNNTDLNNISKSAYEGSKSGLESTIGMQSAHGKAACFGEKTKQYKDPGAMAVTYIMEGIYKYIASNK